MLMMKKPKNLEFEPLRSKNVLLASVAHGISCLFNRFVSSKNVLDYFWLILFVSQKETTL
jgi:hypothetical protein